MPIVISFKPFSQIVGQVVDQGFALGVFGERRTDVKTSVWKYAVIAGMAVDEAGEAVVGISVRALVKDVIGGA